MRNKFIDFARGFIMLFVVLGHVIQVANHGNPDHWMQLVIRSFQMPALFMISGYVTSLSTKNVRWREYVGNKFMRLMVPTFAWAFGWYLINVAVFRFEEFDVFSCVAYPFEFGLWFLRVMFGVLLIHYFLVRPLGLWGAGIASALAIMFSCAVLLPANLNEILLFLPYFEIAWAFGKMKDRANWQSRVNKKIVALFLVLFYGAAFYLHFVLKLPYSRGLATFVGSLLALHIAKCVYVEIANSRVFTFIEYIGKQSLAVYVVHWNCLFLFLSCYLPKYLIYPRGGAFYLYVAVMFAAWMGLTVVAIKIAQRNAFVRRVFLGEAK